MLSLILITPLIGIILILIQTNQNLAFSKISSKYIALLTTIINFILSLILWIEFDSNSEQIQFIENWSIINNFSHLVIGIDGISLMFVILTTFIMPIAILASWSSIPTQKVNKYLITLLVLETILIAVFVVLDLLLFYIAFESSLIPMYLLIGIYGGRTRKIHAAYQFFLYTLLGSLLMLLAIALIVSETGTTDYQLLALTGETISTSRQNIFWLGLFVSFAVKTPMVPVHIWLPEAHAEANVSGSVILAGILLKLAGYGFLRWAIPLFPEASYIFTPIIFSISVISIIYSSLATLRQVDFKKIIAYSSIGHMSVVNLGLFSNTISGIEGGIFLMLAHGIVSPALFIMVTFLYDRHHTRIIKYYRGLTSSMPLFSLIFFIFTLANMATPLTSNFIGEFLTFSGAFQANPILTILGATGMILAAAYGIWFYNRMVFGQISPYLNNVHDLTRREFNLVLPLLFLTFLLGIFPNILLDPLHLPVSSLIINTTSSIIG